MAKPSQSPEARLRRAAQLPGGRRRARGFKAGLKGLKIPVEITLAASEALELGDEAEKQGVETGELARQLLRVAWEALKGRQLGWPYEVSTETTQPPAVELKFRKRIQGALKGEYRERGAPIIEELEDDKVESS